MTTNVRKLNQDNVLGVDEDELSPNEFNNKKKGGSMEDEQQVSPKKKSSLLPLVGGILMALGIVVFFGWKIVSPYFNRGDVSRDAFTPIEATTHHVQSFEPSPSTATEQNVSTALNLPTIQMPQNTSSGVPLAPLIAAPEVQGGGISKPSEAQAKTVLPTGQSAEDIYQINKRIDSLGVALASLKDVVDKLQLQAKQESVQHVVTVSKPAKPAQAATVVFKPKPKPVVATKKPVPAITAVKVSKDESKKADAIKSENPAAGGMQLQAVLQDRAWFKTANGETVTVSPGEELKGVGIVQQIDADSGRVVFTNGSVYR